MNIKNFIVRFYRAFLYKCVFRFPYSKVRVWALRKLGHVVGMDVYIPDSLTITQNFVCHRGFLTLGDRVSVGPNVTFILASHPNYSKIRSQMISKPYTINIENDVWIGAGSIIMNGVTIGEGSIVGAGSVVTKNIGSHTVVAGNPARELKKTHKEDEHFN